MNITTKTNKQMDTSVKNPSQTDKGTDRKNKPIQQPNQVKQIDTTAKIFDGWVCGTRLICMQQPKK